MPAIEDRLTIAPPRSFIALMACLQPNKTPSTLTLLMACTSSSDRSSGLCGAPVPRMPALLTRMSTLPKRSTVSFMTASHSFSSVTSWPRNTALSPISSATPRPAFALTSVTTTVAPSAANFLAVAFPIPNPPPVTIATLSARRAMILSFSCRFSPGSAREVFRRRTPCVRRHPVRPPGKGRR